MAGLCMSFRRSRTLTIVSGGQTGADRAALDFAIAHGIAHGGWCPRGRLAEDGPIPSRYLLRRRHRENTPSEPNGTFATATPRCSSRWRPQMQGGTALTATSPSGSASRGCIWSAVTLRAGRTNVAADAVGLSGRARGADAQRGWAAGLAGTGRGKLCRSGSGDRLDRRKRPEFVTVRPVVNLSEALRPIAGFFGLL